MHFFLSFWCIGVLCIKLTFEYDSSLLCLVYCNMILHGQPFCLLSSCFFFFLTKLHLANPYSMLKVNGMIFAVSNMLHSVPVPCLCVLNALSCFGRQANIYSSFKSQLKYHLPSSAFPHLEHYS